MKRHDLFSLAGCLLLSLAHNASANIGSRDDRDCNGQCSTANAAYAIAIMAPRDTGPTPSISLCPSCSDHSPRWAEETKGMAKWWVSEPYLSLRIEDEPTGYMPARGPWIGFRLFYRQRGDFANDNPTFFGVGPNWSLSLREYMVLESGAHVLHRGGAGAVVYQNLESPQARDPQSGAVSTALYSGPTLLGFSVAYPDGSVRNYTTAWTNTYYFLTYVTDPNGFITSFSYDDWTGVLQLTAVTDADGLTTQLSYDSAEFPHYVTSVTDPFGRSCTLEYDENVASKRLTNIVDAIGLPSSFVYDTSAAECRITNLITRYGTNVFRYGGANLDSNPGAFNDGNVVNRFIEITEPNLGKHLYLYRQDCSGIMASNRLSISNPQGLSESFDNVDQDQRNSFYWSPLQYDLLNGTFRTSGDPADLASGDYAIGRLRHWLKASSLASFGDVLSLERAPRPDNSVSEGQAYWFDYAGKDSSDKNAQGTNTVPLYGALILANGETYFVRTTRNVRNLPTETIESYTQTDGSLGMRTNQFHFDSNLVDLKQHVGPDGTQVVSNYFNGAHQVLRSYNALNEETVFTYNGAGRLASALHPSGLTSLFTYDGTTKRLLEAVDEPIHRTNTYTYHANGLVATHTDPRGLKSTNYWDALQRLTGTSDISGTTSNVYDRLDLVGVKDRLGLWVRQSFNRVRQVERQTNANGVITGYGYCDCGALSSLTNAVGTAQQEVTTYDYDVGGRRWLTVLPDGSGITNWFDAPGTLIATATSATTNWYGYNHQGRLTLVTNGLSAIAQTTVYDLHDQPLWVTDANGVSLTNSYDALHRLRTRTHPDGGVEAFGYSPRGLVAYTNQLGLTNFFAYDEAGRKTFETNANWEVIRYTNNAASDLLALVDGKGQVTRWNYDHFGRVTNKVDQTATEILRYKYDPNHRLTNRWSTAKGETKYKYDSVGNLTNVDYAVSPDIGLAYDPLDRLTNMVDAVGTTKFTWHTGGLLKTEDGPWADDTVTNTYTKRLRTHLGLAQPTGYWSNAFSYDAAARLTTITSPAGAFGYSYASDASRLTRKITLPNTSYRTNIYDTVARLTGTWLKKNDHTILDAATYDYNAAHQRTAFVDAAGTSVGYTYDPIGQLQIADSSDNGEDRGYTYDPAWNLNYRTNAGTLQNFYVDGENQLTNSTPGGYSTFDGNGNTLSMLSTPRYFGYDDENQLIAITNNPEGLQPKRTTLTYDGKLRLRVRREYNWDSTGGGEESLTLGGLAEPNGVGDGGFWTLASETRYIYDGNRVIQERDENNTPTVSYTRGPDLSGNLEGAGGIGGLLARSHGYSSGNWSTHNFYHADGNGNITYLVDASQSLAASYRYDPFGNTTASSGSLASANSYRFSSKQIHTESGLSYYLYRWYDPSLQRWLNRDPIGEEGGLNLYVGADNDLINGFDAVGLSPTLNPQNQIYAAECLETAANVGAQKLAQEQVKRQIIKKLAEQAAKEWEKKLKTKAGDLVKGRLKRVDDYPSQLEGKTYGELLKDKSPEARLMRKLIEESERLVEKTSGKPR